MDQIAFVALVAVGIDGTAAVMRLDSGQGPCDINVMEDFKDLGAVEWVDQLRNDSAQVKERLSQPGFYRVLGRANPDDDSMNYSHLHAIQQ